MIPIGRKTPLIYDRMYKNSVEICKIVFKNFQIRFIWLTLVRQSDKIYHYINEPWTLSLYGGHDGMAEKYLKHCDWM